MATTLHHYFVVTFADAVERDLTSMGQIDRLYQISQSPHGDWAISEQGQPVATTGKQHGRLAQLLAALDPPPDPAIVPTNFGSDGTWYTFVIQRGSQRGSYRWWVRPPDAWAVLAAISGYVEQIADIPRRQVFERQSQLTQQLFERLAARDLAGMRALYHPAALYRSPLFELQGDDIAAMWRMWWADLPDLRVACRASDIRGSGAYWQATYTFPPTGRLVEHHISADLEYADGLIVRHVDRFNFHEWAHRAYGLAGKALGGQKLFESLVASRAQARLAAYLRDNR